MYGESPDESCEARSNPPACTILRFCLWGEVRRPPSLPAKRRQLPAMPSQSNSSPPPLRRQHGFAMRGSHARRFLFLVGRHSLAGRCPTGDLRSTGGRSAERFKSIIVINGGAIGAASGHHTAAPPTSSHAAGRPHRLRRRQTRPSDRRSIDQIVNRHSVNRHSASSAQVRGRERASCCSRSTLGC